MKQKDQVILSIVAIVLLLGVIAQLSITVLNKQAALEEANQWNECSTFPQNIACSIANVTTSFFHFVGTLFSPITAPIAGGFNLIFQAFIVLAVAFIALMALAFKMGWLVW